MGYQPALPHHSRGREALSVIGVHSINDMIINKQEGEGVIMKCQVTIQHYT